MRHRGLGGHGCPLPRVGWSKLPQALLGSLSSTHCLCDWNKCGEGERKGNCLKITFCRRKYSVLHLPPPPISFRRTGFLLGCRKMVPHSYQELLVWAEAFGPARAAGCGWAEPFGCSWVPELSLCFPQCKVSPWDGLWAPSQRSGSSLLGGSQGTWPERTACCCQWNTNPRQAPVKLLVG